MKEYTRRRVGATFLKASASALLGSLASPYLMRSAMAQDSDRSKTIVVASFGGHLDEIYRAIAKDFEAQRGVTVKWVPGTAPTNIAKIAATKAAPEYDIVCTENITQRIASTQGLLAPLDENIVTSYGDLEPGSRTKGNDGVAIGSFITGFYYNTEEFKKRGWAPPKGWNDLFRPEFRGNLGLEAPNSVQTIHVLLGLSGGNAANIQEGIARFASLKDAVRVLEPSSPKHEEKIVLGEYIVGASSTIRVLPIIKKKPEIAYVLPVEGGVPARTTFSPVKGGPSGALGQELINWFIRPEAQAVLTRELYYGPANGKVTVPDDLLRLGVPDQTVLARMPKVDDDVIVAQRRDWVRQLEKALSR